MLLPRYKHSPSMFALKICLRHRSATSFLSGAAPPRKDRGSALAIASYRMRTDEENQCGAALFNPHGNARKLYVKHDIGNSLKRKKFLELGVGW